MRKRMFVWSVMVVLTFNLGLWAQGPATGVPPFSSTGGGPFDVINLGNGNVHFSIPVLHKAGRRPFSYDLVYDSSVWVPVSSGSNNIWSPVSNWGWTANTQSNLGYVNAPYYTLYYTCNLPGGGIGNPYPGTWMTDPTYVDQFGIWHPFNMGLVMYSTNGQPCLAVPPNHTSQTSTTYDGTGMTLSMNWGDHTAIATTTSGEVRTVSVNTGSGQAVDANGNLMTSNSSGQFFDTLSSTTPVLTVSGTAPNPTKFTYTPPSLTNASFTMNYKAYTVATNFAASGVVEYGAKVGYLVDTIQLPDGTKYGFTYEATPSVPASGACTPKSGTTSCVTARIASVSLPTGGSITYSYSGGLGGANGMYADGTVPTLTRAPSPGGTWTYARTNVSGSHWKTTITDPTANQTVIDFQAAGSSSSQRFYETQRKVYQGSVSDPNLLVTSWRCYNGNYASWTTTAITLPITQTDTYSQPVNGSARVSTVQYSGSFSGSGLVSYAADYDYGVTPGVAPANTKLLRYTVITYATLGNNIFDKPSAVHVYDVTGTTVAFTSYTYDEAGTLTGTSGTPQHIGITGSRGNLTTLTMAASSSTSLSKKFTYYDTGTPNVVTDVNTATTTYVYGSGSCGNSFPTSINEPLSLSLSIVWNCTGGVATQVTDENNKIVTSSYTDPNFWRPASVTDQLQNSTTFDYSPTTVDSYLTFNSNQSLTETGIGFDGLGRPIVTNHRQAPNSPNWDTYPQSYDSNGRLSQVYMPCATGTWTCSTPYTSITYDALNRPLVTTDGGTGTLTRTYSQNDVLVTLGPPPSGGGEHVKSRQYEYDGLGRLTSVCEILASGGSPCGQSSSASGYKTTYTYSVSASYTSQMAVAQGSQTRTYVYDGLGRLTSETNPENGTTSYSYDPYSFCWSAGNDGDLHTKTDANGNVTCYNYDGLHRLVNVAGWANNTWVIGSCKRFRYDAVSNGWASPPTGYSASNANGRMIEAETDDCTGGGGTGLITDEWLSYDARGQMTDVWEKTPNSGGYYHTTAGYAANGAVTSLGLPAAAGSWTYTLDGEGRPFSASNGSTVNVASVTYNAASQPLVISYSALGKDNDTYQYYDTTGRMKSYAFTIGSTPKTITGTYGWNQNGTLQNLAITDPFYAADQQTCNYLYDDLARLSSVDCGATVWQQNFTYDAYGNITKTVPTGGTGITWNPGYSSANNQYTLGGTTYDNDGNLTYDTFNHYTWDAYGQMATINGYAITYDAFGREVEKSNPTREILYSPVGKVAIMNGATTVTASFVPMPGGSSMNAISGATYIRHMNLQRTASVLSTLVNRSVFGDKAFAPFGEVYNVGLGGGETDFAGLSQDTLTGVNDSATRKQHPNQGRWLSPDLAGLAAVDLSNPQTWNRYAYVMNNPLSFWDPLGLTDCPQDKTCDIYGNVIDPATGLPIVPGETVTVTANGSTGDTTVSYIPLDPFEFVPGGGDNGGPANNGKLTPAQCKAAQTLLAREAKYGTSIAAYMSAIGFGDNTVQPFNSSNTAPINTPVGQVKIDWYTDIQATGPSFSFGVGNSIAYAEGKLIWTGLRLLTGAPITNYLPFTDAAERNTLQQTFSPFSHYSDILTPAFMQQNCGKQ